MAGQTYRLQITVQGDWKDITTQTTLIRVTDEYTPERRLQSIRCSLIAESGWSAALQEKLRIERGGFPTLEAPIVSVEAAPLDGLHHTYSLRAELVTKTGN